MMTQPYYVNPGELVESLRRRHKGARAQLAEWLRDPVARLLAKVVRRHALPYDLDALTESTRGSWPRPVPPGRHGGSKVWRACWSAAGGCGPPVGPSWSGC